MSEYPVLDVPAGHDLSDFSRYLWRQKVPHRVVHVADRTLLLVGNAAHAEQVLDVYPRFEQGERPALNVAESPAVSRNILLSLWRAPVTGLFALASIIVFTVIHLDDSYDLLRLLTFTAFDYSGDFENYGETAGQYWRLFTPIFIHGSILHITFNVLWLWYLGARIEKIQGSLHILSLILFTALCSNITQYVYSGAANFGGMSGVNYGLIGYIWMWDLLVPDRPTGVPRSLVIVMLVFLVLFTLGFSYLLGEGPVANAAHVGGLLTGVIVGLVIGALARYRPRSSR